MPEPEDDQLLAAARALGDAINTVDAALARVLALVPDDAEVSAFAQRGLSAPMGMGLSASLGRLGRPGLGGGPVEGNNGCDEVCNSSCPKGIGGGEVINPAP